MFGIVVAGWVAIIKSAYTLSPLLTFGPLLTFWASHEHLGLFLSYSLAHLYTGIGALWCTYALFGSFRSLGLTDILSSLFCYPHDIHVSLFPLFVSFVPFCWLPYHLIYFVSFHSSSFDLSHFIAWSIVISPLTSQCPEILSWKGYLISESVHHCLRVIHVIMYSYWSSCIDIQMMCTKRKGCPCHYVFSLEPMY